MLQLKTTTFLLILYFVGTALAVSERVEQINIDFLNKMRKMKEMIDDMSSYGVPTTCGPDLVNICKNPGVSEVTIEETAPFKVLCDWERWIVVMQRLDGSVHFHNKTWEEYKNGFGTVNSDTEFFLGLDHLHELTSKGFFELRFKLEDYDGVKRRAHYSDFSIGNAQSLYKLGTLGIYSGNAGDSFSYHEGQRFTTMDRDNDDKAIGNCGEQYNSAGWFKSCMESNLMGRYLHGEHDLMKEGVYWETFRGPLYSLKRVEMEIRAKC